MKKWIILLLAAQFLFGAACAEVPVLPVFAWQRDGSVHWQSSPADAQPHTLDDFFVCTVCGSEVWGYDDGSADVYDYDEYGNQTRYTSFDPEGQVIMEIIRACTYANDQLVLEHEFVNGVFFSETVYTVDADGNSIPQRATAWNDDGTTSVNEYDEHGNCVRSAILAPDGAVCFETLSEFALNADGWFYEAKAISRFADGTTFHTEYNQHCDPVRTVNTEADGTVWSDTTYEYAYDGWDKLWCKQYTFGRLAMESEYQDGLLMTETEYPEEGGRYIYEYNHNGDITLITAYDADGVLLSIESFEYDEAEEEEWSWLEE